MKLIEHFIGGKNYSGNSKRKSKVFDPATGEQSAEVKLATTQDVNTAVENAKKAFNLQKALGIVETLINTSVAIMKVAKETTDFTPVQALRTGNMIAMGIAGAAQVAAIASQKFTPSGASGGNVPTPNVSLIDL